MKRTFLQFGSAFLFSVGATAPLSANNPWYVHCEEGCSSCAEGQSSCEPETSTHGAESSYPAPNPLKPLTKAEADAEVARLNAMGKDCVATDTPPMQKAPAGGGGGGTQPMSTFADRGVSADTYDRKNVIFQGLGMGAVKYEEDSVTHEKRPKQVPLLHHVLVYTDLTPAGSGYRKAQYLKSQLGNPDANGLYTIPSNVQPLATTTYRNPEPGTPASGKLDVVHEQRHPQGTGMVTRTIRYDSPLGGSTWSRKYYLGDPVANGTLQTYREVTVERSSNPDNSENNRETTKDRDSAGNLVITSDMSQIMGFYKYGSPVVLSETKHTGLGSSSELTSTWTYYHDAADQASFNKPATLRRNDGQWANYTYQGSPVTGVLVTKIVSGWLDNAAPAVGVAPDENANRVVTNIEARGETGTFGREEKVQGVLVSKSWGERFKDNSGLLVEKNRVETGTSTLLTIRTGYADDESASVAERGRLKSVENADGTVAVYRYQLQGTNLVETAEMGAGTISGVTSGKRTISTYTSDDVLIKEVEVDIASGVELSAKEAIAFGANQQPTRWAYNNDPADYNETTYGCCGIDSTRSRDGVVTTYTRDDLKRPKTEVVRGVTITYTHGKKIIGGTEFPSKSITATAGNLNLDQGTTVYDHAGNEIQRISPDLDGDGNEETTTTTRDYAARTITKINPDGGTIVETSFVDGQNKSITGTANASRYFSHSTHAEQGGGEIMATAPTASGPWTKTYKNIASNTLKTTFNDGTIETVLQTHLYDSLGRLISTKDADNVTQLIAYNDKGEAARQVIDLNLNGQIDAADRVSDTLEDVIEVSGFGPAIRNRSIIYDLANNPVTASITLQSPDGLTTQTSSLGVANPVITVKASYLDRADGSWTDTTTASDGTKQATEYSNWLPVTRSHLDAGNTVIESTTTGYDALHRPVTQINSRTTSAVVTRTAYHANNGLMVSITEDVTIGNDRVSSFSYDSVGRRVSVTHPDNSVTHTTYWPTGNEKATWGSQTNPTVKLYDSEGRLTKLRTFRSSNLALAPDETTSDHDETEWIYNVRGQLHRKEYADGKGTNYTYTPGGRLHIRTWARTEGGVSLVTTYGYSTAGELTTTDYSDATPDVVIVLDKLGRQQSITNEVATSVFIYDPNTLALDYETISYDLNGDSTTDFTRVIDRSRDNLGRGTGFQLKDGSTVEDETAYTYSATSGRLASVAGTSSPGAFTYGYTPGSSLIASVIGPVHTVSNTWDTTRDLLDYKENKISTTMVSKHDYGVNELGQRTTISQTSDLVATRGVTWGYDSLGQVTNANSTDNAFDRAYQYDAIGNRIEARDGTTVVTGTPNYAANELNQYGTIGSLSPIHDHDGNAISYPLPVYPGNLSTLAWDAENRLISATVDGTTVSYLYDSQSRRIARTVDSETTVYLYDGWNVVTEYATTDLESFELRRSHLWGMDLSGTLQGAGGVGGLLAVRSGSKVHYPAFDGNGNVSEYLNSTGAIAARFEYDPFGNTVMNTDTAGVFPYRFSTKPIDVATGLYYYGYRFYDSMIGRWPSRDPIGEEGGMNLYKFVNNNSIYFSDYLGWKNNYFSYIFGGHGWHQPDMRTVEKSMMDTVKSRDWDAKRDRVSAVSCFNGNINSRFPRSIKSQRDQFDAIMIPDFIREFNAVTGKYSANFNFEEPGYLWRRAPVRTGNTNVYNSKGWSFTGEEEAYLLAEQKIKDAENQAEKDMVEFRQENKPCSITVAFRCPATYAFDHSTIDFSDMAAPPGKDFPCGYSNTYRYRKNGSRWDGNKFNEDKK